MKSKIKVGLAQINNSFSGQGYLPYSAGILQSFCQRYLKEPNNFEFLLPVYSRMPVNEAMEHLLPADIICFSTYVWNERLSLKIAEEFKKIKSQALVVFGGPQIPNEDIEGYLRQNRFIDIACHDEGENTLLGILESYVTRNWENVPSISYLDSLGRLNRNLLGKRISDIDKIPSPYLEGVFDRLLQSQASQAWLALWETNRGCPFSCTYCDWGSATKNQVYPFDLERLFREIDWFSKNKIEFIFCCDANFSLLERDIEIVKYFASNKRKYGYPRFLSVQSTKSFNEASYAVYRVMSDSGLNKGVSLSLQSTNAKTLKNIGRSNIPMDVFREVQHKLASFNIETFTDIILGLPGETYESFSDGVSSIIESGQHNRIQFNNLSILPNARMSEPEYQKRFGLEVVETRLINIHGSLSDEVDVYETQKLVIGTASMPKDEWIRTRVFGWMAGLLHFNKLLQIPFSILHKAFPITYRELIEIFTPLHPENLGLQTENILSWVQAYFTQKALDIQKGAPEFCQSKEWLNIWWPADELVLIKLCTQNQLDDFYKESEGVIREYLHSRRFSGFQELLHESMLMNRSVLKLPFQEQDLDISLAYNIWDVYYAQLRGLEIPLQKEGFCYRILRSKDKWLSWDDWCREVVWYGNKKGAYIYGCIFLERQPQNAE